MEFRTDQRHRDRAKTQDQGSIRTAKIPLPLPAVTHLQGFVLGTLTEGRKFGREIRQLLFEVSSKTSLAAFYQMMARLESDGLVKQDGKRTQSKGFEVTEKIYRLTTQGRKEWDALVAFYRLQADKKNAS